MERRLSEAAIQGNLTSLSQLLEQDPLILDHLIVSCVSSTPLHTAAELGHLDFVAELLRRKPELSQELDSRGCSPLHLAAAKGHVAVVRALLPLGSGLARNADGRTFVHVAAIKGRVAVLEEIIRYDPGLVRAVTDREETCLHLCVKWNRVEAGKVLAIDDTVNWKDCEGNTAMHMAVANKNLQIISYLLTHNESLQVNSLNRNGSTPLDVLRQSPRVLPDMEIEKALENSGAMSYKDLNIIADYRNTRQTTERLRRKEKPVDWLGRKRSALMVVASLIATVAFQAGLTPPGGVWQDDYTFDEDGNPVSNPHLVGESVLAYGDPKAYGLFMIFNTVAFLSSLSIILILVSGLPVNRRRWVWAQMMIMWVAITAQVVTYLINLKNMSPGDVEGVLREVTKIAVLAWLTLMAAIFVGNAVRMGKYGYVKRKARDLEGVGVEDHQRDVLDQ